MWKLFSFFKDFIYLFMFRERWREGKRGRETLIGCLSHTPNWVSGPQPRRVPWSKSNQWCFSLQGDAQPTQPHRPGLEIIFWIVSSSLTFAWVLFNRKKFLWKSSGRVFMRSFNLLVTTVESSISVCPQGVCCRVELHRDAVPRLHFLHSYQWASYLCCAASSFLHVGNSWFPMSCPPIVSF